MSGFFGGNVVMLKNILKTWFLLIVILAGSLPIRASAQANIELDRWIAEVKRVRDARNATYCQGAHKTALTIFEQNGIGHTFTPEELKRWAGVAGRNLNAVGCRANRAYNSAYLDLRAWDRALAKGDVTAHEVEAILGPAMADFRLFDSVVLAVLDRTISKRIRWARHMEAYERYHWQSRAARYHRCMAKFSLKPREDQTGSWIALKIIPTLPGKAEGNGDDSKSIGTLELVGNLEAIVADPDRFGEEALLAALQATKLKRDPKHANAVLVLEDLARRMEYEQQDLARLPALLAETEDTKGAAEIKRQMLEGLLLRVVENAPSYVQASDDSVKALKKVNLEVNKAMKLYDNTHGTFSTTTKGRVATALGGLLSLPGVVSDLRAGNPDASDLLALTKALGVTLGAKTTPAPLAAAATVGIHETSAEGLDVASQALDLLPDVWSGDAKAAAKLEKLIAKIQQVLSVENYMKSAGVETINSFIGSIPFLNAFIRKLGRADLDKGFGSQSPVPC